MSLMSLMFIYQNRLKMARGKNRLIFHLFEITIYFKKIAQKAYCRPALKDISSDQTVLVVVLLRGFQ